MLRYLIILMLVAVSIAASPGSGPKPPDLTRLNVQEFITYGDSVTDQTAGLQLAWKAAIAKKRVLYFPPTRGIPINAGMYTDSTADGLMIELGGDVEIKQSWHIGGNGRDLAGGDANYSTTTSVNGSNYVSGVTMYGGALVLGVGGRLGTFYCRRLDVLSQIRGLAGCAGVHVYTHSNDVYMADIDIASTQEVSGQTGGLFIDPYTTVDSSQPRNIRVGRYRQVTAHRNGLYIDGQNIRFDQVLIDSAGLNGIYVANAGALAGTVDSFRTRNISFGDVRINTAGGTPSASSVEEKLKAGILVEGYITNVHFENAIVKGCREEGIRVQNNARDVTFGYARVDSSSLDLTYSTTARAAVMVEGATVRNVHFGELFIRKASGYAGNNLTSIGLLIDKPKNVSVGKLTVREGFTAGLKLSSTYDNFWMGSGVFVLDTHGCQLGGDWRGPANLQSVSVDSCYGNGIWFAGMADTASIFVGSAKLKGFNAGSSYAGLMFNNADGNVYIQNAEIRDYTGSSRYGVYAQPNNGGKVHLDRLYVTNCQNGLEWSATENDGFSFGAVEWGTNITQNHNAAFRTDADISFGKINDSTFIGRFPVSTAAPTDGYVPKYNAASNAVTWQADATSGSSTTDLTVAGSGGVINSTPHNLYVGHASNGAMTALGAATDGQIPIGATGFAPVLATITGTTNEVTVGNGANQITIGIADPLIVAKGGTGGTIFTDGGLLVGSGTGAVTNLAVATNGQIPIGDGTTAPTLATITGVANETDVTNGAGSITIGIIDPLTVAKGGTGAATLTDGGILLGSGTGAVTPMAVLGNGALVVGDGTTDPNALTMGTSLQQLRVNAGATALEWATISGGSADGSGVWDSLTTGTRRSDISLIPTAGDTALRITSASNVTTLATDLTVPRSFVVSSAGGVTISGGALINQFQDSTEIENEAGTGKGWFLTRFAPGDSGRFLWPPATGTSFTDTWGNGKFLRFFKVGSTTAPDSSAFASIDASTDLTGIVPMANGGSGANLTATNGAVIGMASGVFAKTAAGTTGDILRSGGTGVPTWSTLLPMANGGTNAALTAANGAIPYSTASAFALLAAGTSGQLFTSGGAGAPTWTTSVPIANGGTNATATPPTNGVMYFDGTRYVGLTNGTTGQVLNANTGAAPSWGAGGGGGVTISIDTSNNGVASFPMDEAPVISADASLYLRLTDVGAYDSVALGIRPSGVTQTEIANGQVKPAEIDTNSSRTGGNGPYKFNGVTIGQHRSAAQVTAQANDSVLTLAMEQGTSDTTILLQFPQSMDSAADKGKTLIVGSTTGAGIHRVPLAFGVLGPVGGGTGLATIAANNVILGNGTSAVQVVAPSTNGNVLTSNGTTWTSAAPSGGGNGINDGVGFNVRNVDATPLDSSVDLISGTGITITPNTTPAINTATFAATLGTSVDMTTEITGIAPTANGGTGLGGATPFTANGVFVASSVSALTTTAQGAANTFLRGNGASAPTFNAVNLNSADVTSQLTLNKGGTGANLTAVNGAVIAVASSVFAQSAAGTTGQFLRSGGAGVPTWSDLDSASIPSGIVTGYHQRYRTVSVIIGETYVKPNQVGDSITMSDREPGYTPATSFDHYLFYDSTNQASEGDDSIYVDGNIPKNMYADSLLIVYKTNNATYASNGGIQDIHWFYTTGNVQQPGSGTPTGTSNAVNLASTSWAAYKIDLAGVLLTANTWFKVRLVLDFTADNQCTRIGRITLIGREQ